MSRTYGLSGHWPLLDLVDAEEENGEKPIDLYERIEMATMEIGIKVANDEKTFIMLLPEILTVKGPRLFSFARGLAEGCKDPLAMWQDFCDQLTRIDVGQRNYQALRGFLCSLSKINIETCEQILNDAVTNEVLNACFPLLQASVDVGKNGAQRLKQSLEKGLAPIWTYQHLAYGRAHQGIIDDDLCEILKAIASKPDGLAVAIKILHMRLHMEKVDKLEHSDAIKAIGKDLLSQVVFDRKQDPRGYTDFELANIVDMTCPPKTNPQVMLE